MKWKNIIVTALITVITAFSLPYMTDAAERINGLDRYKTAVEISKQGWNEADTVVIAKGLDFPDALAGAPLAYHLDAPILLTRTTTLHNDTEAEIKRLGAKKAIILGGESAVSKAVVDKLTKMGLKVERVAGDNRYETAAAIASKLPASEEVVVANGRNFPDALAVGPYAARNGIPILLTTEAKLHKATEKALQSSTTQYITGGATVVSEDIEDKLSNPIRLAGENRYETTKAIVEGLELGNDEAYIVTGLNFADALTGSVLAAKNNAPILLAKRNELSPSIQELVGNYSSINIIGGESAVNEKIEKAADLISDAGGKEYYYLNELTREVNSLDVFTGEQKVVGHIPNEWDRDEYIILDGTIYMKDYNGNLWNYVIGGSGPNPDPVLLAEEVADFSIEKDKIYYTNYDVESNTPPLIYEMNLDGTDNKLVRTVPNEMIDEYDNFIIKNGYIYFGEQQDNPYGERDNITISRVALDPKATPEVLYDVKVDTRSCTETLWQAYSPFSSFNDEYLRYFVDCGVNTKAYAYFHEDGDNHVYIQTVYHSLDDWGPYVELGIENGTLYYIDFNDSKSGFSMYKKTGEKVEKVLDLTYTADHPTPLFFSAKAGVMIDVDGNIINF